MNLHPHTKYFFLALVRLVFSVTLAVTCIVIIFFETSRATAGLRSARESSSALVQNSLALNLQPRLGFHAANKGNKPSFYKFDRHDQLVLSEKLLIDAGSFSLVCVDVTLASQIKSAYLIWANSSEPKKYYRRRFVSALSGCTYIDVSSNDNWKGEIAEIGLDIYADSPQALFETNGITLHKVNYVVFLKLVLSQWLAVPEWDYSTINRIDQCGQDCIVRPVPSIIILASASCVIYALFQVTNGAFVRRICFAALCSWLCIGVLWNLQLLGAYKHAVDRSKIKNSFAQLSMRDHPRVQAAALAARRHIPERSRVFILHQSANQNFERNLLQYFLIPRRVYNFGQFPLKAVQGGDYIVTFGVIPNLTPDLEKKQLTWRGPRYKDFLKVDFVYQGADFGIYRVTDMQG